MRTKSEVIAARGTVEGCCDRFADYLPCDCLAEAVDDPRAPPKGTIPPHRLTEQPSEHRVHIWVHVTPW